MSTHGIQGTVCVGNESLRRALVRADLLDPQAPTLATSQLARRRIQNRVLRLPADALVVGGMPWQALDAPVMVIDPIVWPQGRVTFDAYRVEPLHTAFLDAARRAIDRLAGLSPRHKKIVQTCLRLSSDIPNRRDVSGLYVRDCHVAGNCTRQLRHVSSTASWTYLVSPLPPWVRTLDESAWVDPDVIRRLPDLLRTITVKHIFSSQG
jgi:hypothetical protein